MKKVRSLSGEPGLQMTIVPGALAGEMAELARTAGWDVKPSRSAAADLKAALQASAAGHLVLFVSPRSRVPTHLAQILVPHDGTPATSLTLATVSGAAVRSHATIVVLHVAARELPSQSGSFPAPRLVDHCCHDWREWREEFARRFCRFFPDALLRVELAIGPREESILKVARELPADLLIFAWGGVLRANRARTLCTVSALAPCPVLLVAGQPPVVLDAMDIGLMHHPAGEQLKIAV